MIDPDRLGDLKAAMDRCVEQDRHVLEELREAVRPLRPNTKRIHPRSTTAIALVGTDGGNNQIAFDPFLVQLVRVVDSNRSEYCLEIVSPRTDLRELASQHVNGDAPRTQLGHLMKALGVATFDQLSHMISAPPAQPKPSWINVYRELIEWSVLLSLVRDHQFASDVVIVRDGFLRSKVFRGYLFRDYRQLLEDAIASQFARRRRRIFLSGIAKRSKVIQTYRLALALEGVLRTNYAAYVEVPRELEQSVYEWSEYARGDEQEIRGREGNRFVAGRMFLVKFGSRPQDPVWAVDLLESQIDQAATVLGYLLADAEDGFPVPFYPQCLQKAHEHAALVDFDTDVLQDQIVESIRAALGSSGPAIDEFVLQDQDVSAGRYGDK